jgi:hypothetical protein
MKFKPIRFFYQWIFNVGSVKNHMCRQLILPSTAQNASRELWSRATGGLARPGFLLPPPLTKNPGYASGSLIIIIIIMNFILTR